MLRLFHSVTKGRPCGVHQCSCSNQVLLCMPLRQGAWKEGQEGLPHLRKEERAGSHVTAGCSRQNEAGSGFAPCTLHKWGRHPHQLKAGHSHPATRFQFPQLKGQVCMHERQRVIGTVRAAPDGILGGVPWGSRPFYQSLCWARMERTLCPMNPWVNTYGFKDIGKLGSGELYKSTGPQTLIQHTWGPMCLVSPLERWSNAHTVCYITFYWAAHHNLSVFL